MIVVIVEIGFRASIVDRITSPSPDALGNHFKVWGTEVEIRGSVCKYVEQKDDSSVTGWIAIRLVGTRLPLTTKDRENKESTKINSQ
jgi:hypothetical protein